MNEQISRLIVVRSIITHVRLLVDQLVVGEVLREAPSYSSRRGTIT